MTNVVAAMGVSLSARQQALLSERFVGVTILFDGGTRRAGRGACERLPRWSAECGYGWWSALKASSQTVFLLRTSECCSRGERSVTLARVRDGR